MSLQNFPDLPTTLLQVSKKNVPKLREREGDRVLNILIILCLNIGFLAFCFLSARLLYVLYGVNRNRLLVADGIRERYTIPIGFVS